ncbi:MAG TPA: nitrile hydratase subunit alpha, partial [Streptosporangiaceae bacterium]|nr:nitrile hydratase subunit alpha [Streptosporangiaceae bacterium]
VLIAPDEVLESERSSVITGMVVARAWRDPGYRSRLLSSPREVLIDEGLEIPDGMAIRVFEDTPAIRHIHLTSLTTEATELVPVLREILPLPEGSEVRLIQNTEQALCLVIPLAPPEPQTLTDVDVLRRLAPRASAFAAGDVIATVVSDAFMEAAGEAAAAAAAAAAVNTTQTETASATAFSQESAEVMTTTQSEGWTMSVVTTPGVESATESMSMSEAAADTSVSTETNVVTLTNTYTTTDVSTTSFESTSNVTTQTTTAETTLTAAEFEAVATTTSAVAEGEAAVVVVAVGAAVLT